MHGRLFRIDFGELANHSAAVIMLDSEDALKHKEREVKR
jgi:hypothetical protein